jgi:hypothetical protein
MPTEPPCNTKRTDAPTPKALELSREYQSRTVTDQEEPAFLANVSREIGELIQQAHREWALERYAHQTEQHNARHSVPASIHRQRAEDLQRLITQLQADLSTIDKHRAERGFIHL